MRRDDKIVFKISRIRFCWQMLEEVTEDVVPPKACI
jgi:hypothetical protein